MTTVREGCGECFTVLYLAVSSAEKATTRVHQMMEVIMAQSSRRWHHGGGRLANKKYWSLARRWGSGTGKYSRYIVNLSLHVLKPSPSIVQSAPEKGRRELGHVKANGKCRRAA